MPKFPADQTSEQLGLELMLLELESVEHNIKNNSDEKKDILDFIDTLNEQLDNNDYLYELITQETLNLDRSLE